MASNKVTPPNAGIGRVKGVPNKITADIKEMLREALNNAGGVAYFEKQAEANPKAFMALIGKIIPAEIKQELTGAKGTPLFSDEERAAKISAILAVAQARREAEEDVSDLG
jgi:hypothetical protein